MCNTFSGLPVTLRSAVVAADLFASTDDRFVTTACRVMAATAPGLWLFGSIFGASGPPATARNSPTREGEQSAISGISVDPHSWIDYVLTGGRSPLIRAILTPIPFGEASQIMKHLERRCGSRWCPQACDLKGGVA